MMPGLPLPAKEDCKPSALRSLPMLMMVMTLGSGMVMMVMAGWSQAKARIRCRFFQYPDLGPCCLC